MVVVVVDEPPVLVLVFVLVFDAVDPPATAAVPVLLVVSDVVVVVVEDAELASSPVVVVPVVVPVVDPELVVEVVDVLVVVEVAATVFVFMEASGLSIPPNTPNPQRIPKANIITPKRPRSPQHHLGHFSLTAGSAIGAAVIEPLGTGSGPSLTGPTYCPDPPETTEVAAATGTAEVRTPGSSMTYVLVMTSR